MGILILLGIVGFWVVVIVRVCIESNRQRQLKALEEENHKQYTVFLRENTQGIDHYLSMSDCDKVADNLIQKASVELGRDCSRYKDQTIGRLVYLNSVFLKEEDSRYNYLFSNILGRNLDAQQREALLRDEDYQLVLGGAGSGKTLTIVGKVAYLCAKKHLKPEEILLISFTNKAAEEMTERLSNQFGVNVRAYTFHKLGLEIIRNHASSAPNIADDNLLESIINRYYEKSLDSSGDTANKLLTFLAYYLYVPADKQEFKTFGDFIEAERGIDMETLKSKYERRKGLPDKISIYGEHMKSQEEVMIANFLFLNGIKYEYERPYPQSDFSYKPDFYLSDYDIYLEHFGIDRNGRCKWLPAGEALEYEFLVERKRRLHKEKGTKLLETYSYYQQEGVLLDKLKQILEENGVKLKTIERKTVLKEIYLREDRGLKEFNNLISSFIRLFKAQGYTLSDLNAMEEESCANSYLESRKRLFFSIVEDIYDEYESTLEKTRSIDFSDMIAKSTRIISDEKEHFPYKYIIIDEYQDMGRDRYRLIKAILEATGAKLICIGDDWQSIYRFAGSDISLFTAFDEYWGQAFVSRIEKTYRNSQDLINICGEFIMRNPAQVKKDLISDKKTPSPLKRINYNKENQIECLGKILDNIYNKFGTSTVFLLGRNNYDIEFLKKAEDPNFTVSTTSMGTIVKYQKHPGLKISFLTAHKSKGLEADNVVIINCKNDYLGFPNKIADDPILQLLLSKPEGYRYAEERRLMYVALTRTKNYTYLLTPENTPSEFILELEPLGLAPLTSSKTKKSMQEDVKKEEIHYCPRCQTGQLVKRSSIEGEFYGCSHYPKCDYICKELPKPKIQSKFICSKCGCRMVLRHGIYGDFYGCVNYPRCKNTFNVNKKKDPPKKRYSRKT